MGVGAPWYPDVEPDDLHRAAQVYRDLGTAIDNASTVAECRRTGPASRADIIIDIPSPARRGLWPDPDGAWILAVGEVKTTDSAKDAYSLLTANQQAVLVPLAANGGTMSGPLAALLDWGNRTIAPGQASQLLVFRIGRGDFLRMPISLRRLLNEYTFQEIVGGAAGMRNARRMASFLKTVVVVVEQIK